MQFHDLAQGSNEWLEFRKTHVGASDAPYIFKGNIDGLVRDKMGLTKKFSTPAMQRGHELEPIARMIFEEEIKAAFPSAVVTHDVLHWMSTSLDGICQERKEILEIKCCKQKIHDEAKAGIVPKDHFIQIQHQLFVTDYDLAHYCHFNGKEIATVLVNRDDRIINEIVKKSGDFYKELCVALNRTDEESDEIFAPILDHKRGSILMKELMEIRTKKAPLCQREKELREEIMEIAPDHNFVLGGVLVRRSQGRISYDTKQMMIDGIDLKKYEKVGAPSWVIG